MVVDRVINIIISLMELFEAEIALWQENLYRLAYAVVLLLVGGLMLLIAAGFLLGAIYMILQIWLSPGLAALTSSLAALLIGGVCLWRARQLVKNA
ncbi:MAG: phage holin family protein [Syntrophomonadaceae bacterium]|nr:phage holin family protein [Syntrophomonadaceae bacterium]